MDFGADAGAAPVTTYRELLQAAGISWQVYANNQVGDSASFPGGRDRRARRPRGGHRVAARRGSAADEQDPRRARAVLVHRRTNCRLHADVTVNRTTGQVTAALTNAGPVGAGLAVYPDDFVTFAGPPVTVLPSAPRSYVWDATATAGRYTFSVYGPDGFLTSFAGQVVPAGQDDGPVPAVTATLKPATVAFTLANEGRTDRYGYYDVVITASTSDGFRRRYAGRIA